MLYVFIGLFAVMVFALCFGVDRLVQHFKNRDAAAGVVRPPRRSVVLGIVLTVFGLCCVLVGSRALLLAAGIVLILMGAVLLASYFLYAVAYDESGFTCRRGRRRTHYHYNQIRGEQVLQTRSGLVASLYVGDDLVQLSSAMTGVQDFFPFAHRCWCRDRGLDPEQCPPPNPAMLAWFPAPDSSEACHTNSE